MSRNRADTDGAPLVIPSSGPGLPRRRVRMLALAAVRDEMRYLPGFVANAGAQFDGIIALDDGSTDGSRRFLERSPPVIEVLGRPAPRPDWDEVANHRSLVAAALRHGADWVMCLDADERVERRFRVRAERVIRRGEGLGLSAYAVRMRELWGSPERFRVDGIWGRKAVARFFRVHEDHHFDTRPLHAAKAPLQGRRNGRFALADLEVYHLRMIRPEDRQARRERYERADPEALWQPGLGYAYLTDESGLRLQEVPRRRRFIE